ncbi:MAG: hypothetical protein QNJ81_09005 [Acidimicrobiia bacterium]|nr:hypothetical protein [Acidimicrobiia bacterium]
MRQSILLALAALALLLAPGPALADAARCESRFPGADWQTYEVDAPVTLATAGMTNAMSLRFAADVTRVANLIQAELGGLDGAAVCLATPELSPVFSDLVAPGQRLHVGVFAEEKIMAISAVETRTIDDAIAYGLPHIAVWHVADELGFPDGYPEPLGSTIAHWYLARDTDRLAQYRSQLVVAIYLDDPNPEERTLEDAAVWVGDVKGDPFFFDPQFVGSQMGVFIDYAVAEEGTDILRAVDQATWADLENRWRISIRDEFPRGNFGVWIGVGIFVGFIVLAVLLAWGHRIQKRRAARRRPTPPADESLFESQLDGA